MVEATVVTGTVLVVDDDATFLRSLVRLAGAAGYRCEAAASAAEARTALEDLAGEVDVVLCDIQMPGENGQPYVIFSLGADGQQGGDGENADIRSDRR